MVIVSGVVLLLPSPEMHRKRKLWLVPWLTPSYQAEIALCTEPVSSRKVYVYIMETQSLPGNQIGISKT